MKFFLGWRYDESSGVHRDFLDRSVKLVASDIRQFCKDRRSCKETEVYMDGAEMEFRWRAREGMAGACEVNLLPVPSEGGEYKFKGVPVDEFASVDRLKKTLVWMMKRPDNPNLTLPKLMKMSPLQIFRKAFGTAFLRDLIKSCRSEVLDEVKRLDDMFLSLCREKKHSNGDENSITRLWVDCLDFVLAQHPPHLVLDTIPNVLRGLFKKGGLFSRDSLSKKLEHADRMMLQLFVFFRYLKEVRPKFITEEGVLDKEILSTTECLKKTCELLTKRSMGLVDYAGREFKGDHPYGVAEDFVEPADRLPVGSIVFHPHSRGPSEDSDSDSENASENHSEHRDDLKFTVNFVHEYDEVHNRYIIGILPKNKLHLFEGSQIASLPFWAASYSQKTVRSWKEALAKYAEEEQNPKSSHFFNPSSASPDFIIEQCNELGVLRSEADHIFQMAWAELDL